MTDKPIIFSPPMVRALLEGRKTQTRRVLKGEWQPMLEGHDRVKTWFAPPNVPREGIPNQWAQSGIWAEKHGEHGYNRFLGFAPYTPGDRLYVREAFSYETLDVDRNGFMPPWYWADGNPTDGDFTRPKPSIHMPRWASRLTLTVTEVRVQRLQEISEEDAVAEGIEPFSGIDPDCNGYRDYYKFAAPGYWLHPRASFGSLWNSLHGPDAWDQNPWVVAVSFTVERRNIDA
jgi:hypothetical protein